MHIHEAISKINEKTPFIQSSGFKPLNIKIKPLNDDIKNCELYADGELISSNYKLKIYDMDQQWEPVE